MDLEKKIKWVKKTIITSAIIAGLGVGYLLYQEVSKKSPSPPLIVEAYNNIKQRIENIDENDQYLKAYLVEDTLLNTYLEQQLELDSLTKARFEKHLSKMEKDPEFIEYNAQLKEEQLKNSMNMNFGMWAAGLGLFGVAGLGKWNEKLNTKRQKLEK